MAEDAEMKKLKLRRKLKLYEINRILVALIVTAIVSFVMFTAAIGVIVIRFGAH